MAIKGNPDQGYDRELDQKINEYANRTAPPECECGNNCDECECGEYECECVCEMRNK